MPSLSELAPGVNSARMLLYKKELAKIEADIERKLMGKHQETKRELVQAVSGALKESQREISQLKKQMKLLTERINKLGPRDGQSGRFNVSASHTP